VADRRRRDTQVHFTGTGIAQQAHNRAAGIAAHDTVIHQHDTPADKVIGQCVELELNTDAPQLIVRLDERPADIVIPDKRQLIRNP
jgi:hypothetical protein